MWEPRCLWQRFQILIAVREGGGVASYQPRGSPRTTAGSAQSALTQRAIVPLMPRQRAPVRQQRDDLWMSRNDIGHRPPGSGDCLVHIQPSVGARPASEGAMATLSVWQSVEINPTVI
ncbi:hypothetical protein DPEC_G00084290 [Dallia pectoralis]|uniref:Uncharacterized protein n=1 Tax=Dallia pectoralis TaxID=75939 RepID=A0ACC2GZG0_DALPE|nr:hypothetical protein DPEC_G00084290 [Dallia pectoralis]